METAGVSGLGFNQYLTQAINTSIEAEQITQAAEAAFVSKVLAGENAQDEWLKLLIVSILFDNKHGGQVSSQPSQMTGYAGTGAPMAAAGVVGAIVSTTA